MVFVPFALPMSEKKSDRLLISQVEFVDGQYKFENRPVNGEIIDYYENDVLKFRYRVLEGRLHGLATEFYSDGNVKSKRNYTFNKLFGSFVEYFHNGDIKVKFKVGHNAYGSGEYVTELKVASKGSHKLKSKNDGIIHFIAEDEDLQTSEFISILNQSDYKILSKEGKMIFKN